MSDFSVTPVESCSIEPTPQDAEAAHTKFQRLVRMVGSSRNRTAVKLWKDLAYAVRKNSQIFNVTNEEETVQPLFNAKVNDYAELAASNEAMNLVDDDRREDKPNSDAIIQTQEIIQIIQHHDEPLSNSNINEGAQEEEEIIPTNPMDKAADDVDEPQNHSQIVDSECDHVHDVNTTGTENISERCISTVNSTEHESQLENSNTLHNTGRYTSSVYCLPSLVTRMPRRQRTTHPKPCITLVHLRQWFLNNF